MTRRRAIAAGTGALLLLALGACKGQQAPGGNVLADNSIDNIVPIEDTGQQVGGVDVVSPEGDVAKAMAGATPMKDRVAVLGVLNKRNGEARELKLKPGQSARIGDMVVHLRACERTAPYEQDQYTGAFVQVDVQQLDKSWHRVFSGWLYKERPSLNVVQHPIYDVWPKSCTMSFPATGKDTMSVGAGPQGSEGDNRSSAKKSPSTEASPSESPAEVSPSAAPSNAT